MALQPVNARDTLVQVLASDGITWVEIEGKTNVAIDNSSGEVIADKATYSTGGHEAGIKTQIGASAEVSYLKLADAITNVPAPGQARVEELGGALGAAGLGQIRIREQNDTVWKRWPEAVFSVGSTSGNPTDLRSGSYTIKRNAFPVLEAV